MVSTRGGGTRVLNADIYQLPHTSNTWHAAAIYVGIVGLTLGALVALALTPRRLSGFVWPSLGISVASTAMAFGAVSADAQLGPFPLAKRGPFTVPSLSGGPGEIVTLVGAAFGILAVLMVLTCWVIAARPGKASPRSSPEGGPTGVLAGIS